MILACPTHLPGSSLGSTAKALRYKLFSVPYDKHIVQVIEETVSPTWDEMMVFDEILVYGRREDIKANPPMIIIETYDQDKVSAHFNI